MVTVSPIRSEADYETALARVYALMDSPAGSPEADELDVLATLVEAYEDIQFPIPASAPARERVFAESDSPYDA